MRANRVLPCLLLLAPIAASAQDAIESDAAVAPTAHWSFGVGGVIRHSEYAGEGDRSLIVPYIGYESERFYWRGATAGYRFIDGSHFTLAGIVAARLDGIDVDDFGVAELARRGIDRNLLEDRDHSADAGLSAIWKGAAGELELDVRADITDTSGGYQASADYRYPIRIGRVTLTPGLGVTLLSEDVANYYYGTLDEEVARGVIDYKPGRSTIAHAGVSAIVPFASHWAFIANAQYRSLPDEIKDSPLVELDTDNVTMLFLGVARRF